MPQSQVADELTVPRDIGLLQILEETAPLADHLEQAAAAVVILHVSIEVSPKVVDASREEGDLDRGAATIVLVELILLDDVVLVDSHFGVVPPRESVAAREAWGPPGAGVFPSRES
jgi:hypothetical protein